MAPALSFSGFLRSRPPPTLGRRSAPDVATARRRRLVSPGRSVRDRHRVAARSRSKLPACTRRRDDAERCTSASRRAAALSHERRMRRLNSPWNGGYAQTSDGNSDRRIRRGGTCASGESTSAIRCCGAECARSFDDLTRCTRAVCRRRIFVF